MCLTPNSACYLTLYLYVAFLYHTTVLNNARTSKHLTTRCPLPPSGFTDRTPTTVPAPQLAPDIPAMRICANDAAAAVPDLPPPRCTLPYRCRCFYGLACRRHAACRSLPGRFRASDRDVSCATLLLTPRICLRPARLCSPRTLLRRVPAHRAACPTAVGGWTPRTTLPTSPVGHPLPYFGLTYDNFIFLS